jgi:hypothetical protein
MRTRTRIGERQTGGGESKIGRCGGPRYAESPDTEAYFGANARRWLGRRWVSIDLQQIDRLYDGKGESDEKKKDRSADEAESREGGMASVASAKSKMMIVKAYTMAPVERHAPW